MTFALKLTVFVLSLIVSITYLRKKFKKNNRTFSKQEDTQFQQIQAHWSLIRILADDCDILKADAIVDKKDAGGEEGLFELRRFGVFPDESDWETQKRTRILCHNKKSGEEAVYEVTVHEESDTVGVKLYLQGYIDVYKNPANDSEVYFDLRFLEKTIEESMQKTQENYRF